MKPILACLSAILLLVGGGNKSADAQRPPGHKSSQQVNSSAATSSWRIYSNTRIGFEFRYPAYWGEGNSRTDKADVLWINFVSSAAGRSKNVLYVKVFPDGHAYSVENELIAGHATATQVTVDKTTQTLYGNFFGIPTAMISNNNLFIEIGDPSREEQLELILSTFRFLK